MKIISKNEIEKLAVGYPYPTAWVEIVVRKYDYDLEKIKEILSSNAKVKKAIEGTTEMNAGVTYCCAFDFGEIAFKRIPPKFCPLCGKKICLIR